MKAIVVGAGVAGMSAAMHLLRSGFEVDVYEATKQVGGRCYSFLDEKSQATISELIPSPLGEELFLIDNGQHFFSGCYTEFISLLD